MLPTIATGNVASALAGEYEVANSLRFNSGSSDYLEKTQTGSNGDLKKWTLSMWVKRAKLGTAQELFSFGENNSAGGKLSFDSNDFLVLNNDYQNGGTNETDMKFRDVSAFYHIIWACDVTQSDNADRWKVYVNGNQVTLTGSPSISNADGVINRWSGFDNWIGGNARVQQSGNPANYSDVYFAEVVFIDGTQLDQNSFGEFDTDSPTIWKPKDVSGLTFGTNGYYLDFENASSLGADVSGNSNNFTANNLTSIDQSTDTCTNNFATINSLENYYTPHTLSEGNLRQTTASSNLYAPSISTIALSQGKWYFECKYVSRSSSDNYNLIGVKSTQITNTNYLGQNQHDYGYYSSSGKYYTNGSAVTYGDSYDQGDIIGVYLDLDNNKLYFAKNGALQNSGTGISITDPASTPLGHYFFATGDYGSSLVIVNDWNFGGTQSFSISSGNTDPNGYGNFEYDPSSGTFDGGSKSFYALNTKNLAEFG